MGYGDFWYYRCPYCRSNLRREPRYFCPVCNGRLREPPVVKCDCGYLLKGLPGPRCPECGRLIKSTA